jgi:hypothetical protein
MLYAFIRRRKISTWRGTRENSKVGCPSRLLPQIGFAKTLQARQREEQHQQQRTSRKMFRMAGEGWKKLGYSVELFLKQTRTLSGLNRSLL